MDLGLCIGSKIDDIDYVVRAEELGYSHAWYADSQMIWSDVYACLALAATRTTRIQLGTGVSIVMSSIIGQHVVASRRQWSRSGSWTRISVPSPGGLLTSIDPPRASARSRRPIRPEPRAGSAPPTPSSRIERWRVSSRPSQEMCTTDADACLVVLVSASETT